MARRIHIHGIRMPNVAQKKPTNMTAFLRHWGRLRSVLQNRGVDSLRNWSEDSQSVAYLDYFPTFSCFKYFKIIILSRFNLEKLFDTLKALSSLTETFVIAVRAHKLLLHCFRTISNCLIETWPGANDDLHFPGLIYNHFRIRTEHRNTAEEPRFVRVCHGVLVIRPLASCTLDMNPGDMKFGLSTDIQYS